MAFKRSAVRFRLAPPITAAAQEWGLASGLAGYEEPYIWENETLSFGVSAGWLTGQSHEFAYGASAEIAYLLNGHYQVFVGANGERYFYSYGDTTIKDTSTGAQANLDGDVSGWGSRKPSSFGRLPGHKLAKLIKLATSPILEHSRA